MKDKERRIRTKKMVLSALFLATGMILPVVTMQIPAVGNMLLPMHIPVLLCGFICGAPYGALTGALLPILRSAVFGTPVMMPAACAMSFELLCYGFFSGFLYGLQKKHNGHIFISLILTMLVGRGAWGIAEYLLCGIMGSRLTWKLFMMQAFVNAIPGIMIQLIIIPWIVKAAEKYIKENEWQD